MIKPFVFCFVLAFFVDAQSSGSHRQPVKAMNQTAWQQLLRLEGKDLQGLEEGQRQQLEELLDAFLPADEGPFYFGQMNYQGVSRYVLIEGESRALTPEKSTGRIYVFTADGQLLSDNAFLIGRGLDIVGATLLKDSHLRTPVIEYRTRNDMHGEPIAREYYALRNDRIVLVRLEDGADGVMPNRYTASGDVIGPIPPDRTADEWETSLSSNDPVELLWALTWLGGIHSQADVKVEGAGPQPYIGTGKDAELVRQLRGRKSVQERLRQLAAESNSAWIREVARLIWIEAMRALQ